jgi:hypothetical protein
LPSSSAAYEGVYTVNKMFTGTITQNDALKQSGGAQGTVLVATIAATAATPMTVQIKSGSINTTNPTATWSDITSSGNFAQNGVPVQLPMALISGATRGVPFTQGVTVR